MNKQILAFTTAITLSAGVYITDASAASHTVKTGESLWTISKEYAMTVDELQQLNDMDSTLIFPNQKLDVAKEETKYTIQPTDTLFEIAVAHHVTVEQLMNWNGLSSDLIFAGEQLVVDGDAAIEKSVPVTKAQAKKATQPAKEQSTGEVAGTYTMEATAYTAFCTGCSGTTANGTDLRANPNLKVIAVDPRVIPLGTKVWVEGYGEAIAADTGGAIKGNRIDVFIPTKAQAYEWGRKTVTVKVLK